MGKLPGTKWRGLPEMGGAITVEILKEARRLYEMGLGVHWIKPHSKAPVKAGWSSPNRDKWHQVESEYQQGYGLGVRLGAASKIGSGFLANIDIDVKSDLEKHRAEALKFVRANFPEIAKAPAVKTGHGLRLFVCTKEPLQSKKLTSSGDETRVLLPTTDINKRQRQILTEEELKAGWRVRPAWEVEFMSAGKQVVLPPSIHPDTQKPYIWRRELARPEDLPLIGVEHLGGVKRAHGLAVVESFRPAPVDLLDLRFPDHIVEMILGEGVEDRSSACFIVAMAMVKHGFTDDEILTVLTDRDTMLGETAFEHRHTTSRDAAAAWVRDYCLRKAKEEVSAVTVFQTEVITTTLDPEAAEKQAQELVALTPWQHRLKRTAKGAVQPTLENTLMVLQNVVGLDAFKLDTFANREMYGRETPWGGVIGRAIEDADVVNIKVWLATRFKFEPSTGTIFDAITHMASVNAFHPVRLELEALPPWDGVDRLSGWLQRHFDAKSSPEYLAQVFRKWLVASVARVYRPGFKFDWMPVFEGAQGIGKSAFGAILFGQKYFSDWLPRLEDKDAALGLLGKRCVEFSELDSLRRNEVETVKAFITRQVDNVRPPYGRKSLELYRQVVFFGTTNRENYLSDETGNRRFNPVKVGFLDFAALARDRDQLWAEALFIFRNDLEESFYLEGSAREEAIQIRQDRMVFSESELMANAIQEFISTQSSKAPEEKFNFTKFKLEALFGAMGPLGEWKKDSRNVQFAASAIRIVSTRIGLECNHVKILGLKWWRLQRPGSGGE